MHLSQCSLHIGVKSITLNNYRLTEVGLIGCYEAGLANHPIQRLDVVLYQGVPVGITGDH